MKNLLQKTVAKMKKNNVAMSRNCTFSKLTTLGCGGKIYLTLYPSSVAQLVFVARYLARHGVPHCYLGCGSNVLASDADYNGVVVVTTRVRETVFNGCTVRVSCGVPASKLCAQLAERGLSGGEFFGCLPATVGGAVVCNAGCFGQCAANVVESVTVLHNGRVQRLSKDMCAFGYRSSLFKNIRGYLVLWAEMTFGQASPSAVGQTVAQMRQKKAATQPLGCRSAGCVLYNADVSVSALTDRAGLKGFTLGGAQVSEKHAGFVINVDNAASRDIYLLIEYIKNTLSEKFGISAHTELCLINFPSSGQN